MRLRARLRLRRSENQFQNEIDDFVQMFIYVLQMNVEIVSARTHGIIVVAVGLPPVSERGTILEDFARVGLDRKWGLGLVR